MALLFIASIAFNSIISHGIGRNPRIAAPVAPCPKLSGHTGRIREKRVDPSASDIGYCKAKTQREHRTRTLAISQAWNSLSLSEKQELVSRIRTIKQDGITRLQQAISSSGAANFSGDALHSKSVDVCIDFSYETDHSGSELRSLAKQVANTYAMLKRTARPCHLHLTSLGDAATRQGGSSEDGAICTTDTLMSHLRELGVQNWLVSLHAQGPECLVHSATISDIKEKLTTSTTIVYLSPDAVEPLLDIDPQCVYVIGGIVDRSVRGGQTLKRAQEHASSAANGHNDVNGNADVKLEPRTTYNVLCRRLPIQEFIPERANHVLNVDCCVHTLCVYMELKDWAKTFRVTLPKRKLVRGGKKERYRQNREQALQSSAAANGDGDGDGKEGCGDSEGDSDGDGDGDQSIAALAKNSRWQRWVTREIGLHRWSNSEQ